MDSFNLVMGAKRGRYLMSFPGALSSNEDGAIEVVEGAITKIEEGDLTLALSLLNHGTSKRISQPGLQLLNALCNHLSPDFSAYMDAEEIIVQLLAGGRYDDESTRSYQGSAVIEWKELLGTGFVFDINNLRRLIHQAALRTLSSFLAADIFICCMGEIDKILEGEPDMIALWEQHENAVSEQRKSKDMYMPYADLMNWPAMATTLQELLVRPDFDTWIADNASWLRRSLAMNGLEFAEAASHKFSISPEFWAGHDHSHLLG